MFVLLVYQLVGCYSTLYVAIVHREHRKTSWSWYIRLFTVQTSENFLFHVLRFSLHCSCIMIQHQTLRHRKLSKNWHMLLLRPRPIYFVLKILIFVLSIGFCRQFSYGVSVYRFPSWTDGKRCKCLNSPKSILLLFYRLLYPSLIENLRVCL